MAFILYRFSDGHYEEIEVTEEFAKEYAKLEHEERKAHESEKKRGKNIVSLDLLIEKGVDIPDNSSPDPLQELLNKEEDKITLIELADFLTPRQKQVMMMYYENRYTKAEIAEKLKIDEAAVRRHLKAAGHKILKKFS